MAQKSNVILLKVEGFLFSLASIGFIVMFYFKYISKYFLCTSLLLYSAVLFSIIASLQQNKNRTVSKLNVFISALFAVAGLAVGVYFYATGLLSF